MRVFDVRVNGKRLCRAGVGPDGVLDAIVSWVKLTGEAARTARRLEQPVEETRLHVGGLRKGTHVRWPAQLLTAGDSVSISVAAGRTFDPPASQKRQSPRVQRLQEKRYYLRLKEKYEGTRRASRDEATRFLNVDLDLRSSSPLDQLTSAFGRKVIVLYVGKEGRAYGAHLELARVSRDADSAIRRFATLIEKLPPSSRAIWRKAQSREFNIGVQAGPKPYSYDLHLQPETVRALSRINARLGLTVYGSGLTG
jgi:hypothetical protein